MLTIKGFQVIAVLFLLAAAGCGSEAKKSSSADIEKLVPSGQVGNGVRDIKVEAKQYAFIPDPIVVVSGEKVRLEVTSSDVEHGFALPDYNINRELKPHKTEVIEFTAGAKGIYPFHCSDFCGLGHLDMKGSLVVQAAK